MLPRSFYSFCLRGLFVCAVIAKGYAQQPGVQPLPLDKWQLHIGDDSQCAHVDAAGCTVQRFTDDIYRYGIEWRRITITIPPYLLQSKQQLALIVQGQEPVYEIFLNGDLVGGSGSFKSFVGPLDSRAIFKLPANLSTDGRLTIAIRVLSIHPALPAPGFDPAIALLSNAKTVLNGDTLAYLGVNWQHYICFALLGCTGMMFFLLFSVNTRLIEYFWLGALLCLLFTFRLGEFASVVDLGLPSWAGVINYNLANALQTLVIVEFVFSFLSLPVPKFLRLVEIVGALPVLNVFLLAPSLYRTVYSFLSPFESFVFHSYVIAVVVATLYQFLLVPMCFKSKLAEMRWIGGAMLFLTIVEGRYQTGLALSLDFPQYLPWGASSFDLRPVAWLLFALVMLIAMTFRLRRIQDRNRAVEQEMAAARTVQQLLIPDEMPSIPGLLIESAYFPAQEVGGDFFQILPIRNETEVERPSVFIVLGDVSGKGLKAAMTVSLIVGSLRAVVSRCTSPAQLLHELNHSLIGRTDGFATCLAILVEAGGKLTLANAAHPNPYLNGAELQTEPNLPIGIDESVCYSEIVLQLDPDERLTLLTDGIIEAANPNGELYGFERTQAISNRSATTIAEAARDFGQQDDVTVLTLSRA